MNAISTSFARANLARTLDRVVEDHTPVLITRQGEGAAVLVSLEDYTALQETAYLLKSPVNARRLLDSIDQLDRGKGETRDLVES